MSPLRCYGCGEPDGNCNCAEGLCSDDDVRPEHQKWLSAQIVKLMFGAECVDNIRVARVGDRDAEAQYAKQLEKGCCGYVDEYVKHPDGTAYMVGFNYGH